MSMSIVSLELLKDYDAWKGSTKNFDGISIYSFNSMLKMNNNDRHIL